MNETNRGFLHDRFLRGLAMAPRGCAVAVGNESAGYEQLHELALDWAGALLARAQEPPRAVGVLAGQGITAYAGVLAALYTGAAVVPLHAGFPAARTRRMLEQSGASALIADEAGEAALAATGLELPVLAPGTSLVAGSGALTEPRPAEPEDTACILFTSGSTGRPKGVPIRHGSLHHYFRLMDERYDFGPDDVFSQTFDLNFDCAMFDLFCAWAAGARAQAVPPQAYLDLPRFVAEHRMTVWFSTPSAIGLVRRTGGLRAGGMSSLRWSFFAGEALRAADAEDWQRAADRTALENIYGPTELTITVTRHRWSPDTSPGLCVNGLAPIGALHEGHDHLLLDADGDPAKREGELCISGSQLTRGYLDPEDDQGRFLRRAGRTWYRTGDRVRLLGNGELVYLGRLDTQVQLRGWRVELAEVEHALRQCAGVEDAVAVTAEGDKGAELVVFYTGDPTAPAVLARQLRQILPSGMLPRHCRHLPEFPLNSNRKTDRGLLAKEAAELVAPVGNEERRA
ncbi:amino acid adenylation domain-containing protein [Streptomyces sp. NPDC019531]|uniref:amino acid adenylation domain-containing protein n=1 Tax=Streptomyces sp. NPDC019531 TaxID=3365062 RepID=UPI00384D9856